MKPPPGSGINWAHPLSRGLVGAFLFTEAGGNYVRNIASNIHGVFKSAAGDPKWVRGPYGPALEFDGSNDGINLGDNFDFAGSEFSIHAFTLYIAGGIGYVIGKYNPGTNNGFFLRQNTGDVWGFGVTSGSDPVGPADPGSWQSISGIVRIQPNIQKLFKNARLIAEANNSPAPIDNGLDTFIGNRHDNLRPFEGIISHVLLWERALEDSEVQWLHEQPFDFMEAQPRYRSLAGLATAAEAVNFNWQPTLVDQFKPIYAPTAYE